MYGVQPGDSLFRIGQRFGLSVQAMIAANPQIVNPNVISPGQVVCVPTTPVGRPPAPPACTGQCLYGVQRGDTLFLIAQRFGVTLQALVAANPQITDPNVITATQVICVPVPVTAPPPVPQPCPIGPRPPACVGGFLYGVIPGDTLFLIAQRFGLSLAALISANPQITDPNVILAGQVICVPTPPPPNRPPAPPVCVGQCLYGVQPGDTLFLIAQRFGVSLEALIAANPQIVNPNVIFPTQVICVPVQVIPPAPQPCPIGPRPPACVGGFLYGVIPGDTMFLIAHRFGISLATLIAANPQIVNPNIILAGQVICVPIPPPPNRPPAPPACVGQCLYGVQPGDTLFLIAQRFGVTLQALLAANPQIVDPNLIVATQVICVPVTVPAPGVCPVVLSVQFLGPTDQPSPVVGGFVQLQPLTTIRATFSVPVNEAFFFLTPTGTNVFEFSSLIGVRAVFPASTVVTFQWTVPVAALGFVFVIGCAGACCGRSAETPVFRPAT